MIDESKVSKGKQRWERWERWERSDGELMFKRVFNSDEDTGRQSRWCQGGGTTRRMDALAEEAYFLSAFPHVLEQKQPHTICRNSANFLPPAHAVWGALKDKVGQLRRKKSISPLRKGDHFEKWREERKYPRSESTPVAV